MNGIGQVLILVAAALCAADGARILGVFFMPAPSHFNLGHKLLRELADRGHEVTMISPFPLKSEVKGYRDVALDGFVDKLKKEQNLFDLETMWVVGQVVYVHYMGSQIAEMTIEHPNVQKLLKSDEKFDLVISEQFMNEIHIGFAHRFSCPYMILSTMGSSSWTNGLVSNPAPYAYIPDLFLKYSSQMNFWERLHNAVLGTFYQIFRELYYLPKQDATLRKHFNGAPSLADMFNYNLSMILLNSHPAIGDPQPHVPAMVEIGGFHVSDPKPLPKDLKKYMDDAKEGVILFSMGSNLKSSQLPLEKRSAILSVFAKLNLKILWKWEEETLPGQPENVKLSKWLPQNDIMAHPNLRLFITHGGLLSTIEAVHHGVPIVGIPIFGDQKLNMAHASSKGYGLTLNYAELSEETLERALREVLDNPSYRTMARKKSKVLRDQPLRPVDAAVFWVEHTIRHGGTPHFRTPAHGLHWTQLYMVDVTAFIVAVGVVLFTALRLCMRRRTVTKKDAMKKKKN